MGVGDCNQFHSVLPFVCTHFSSCNSKTVTSIKLKFGGQILHGLQMDYSKFGEIRVKINVRIQLGVYTEICFSLALHHFCMEFYTIKTSRSNVISPF